MDINASLDGMGRYGRIAKIGAVVCLLVACILLLASLISPSGNAAGLHGQRNIHTILPG